MRAIDRLGIVWIGLVAAFYVLVTLQLSPEDAYLFTDPRGLFGFVVLFAAAPWFVLRCLVWVVTGGKPRSIRHV